MRVNQEMMQRRWEQFCCALMVAALACTLFSSLVFVRPVSSDGVMSGTGGVLMFGLWLFGMSGIFLCFLERAVARVPVMLLGYGWSAIALTYAMIVYACPFNELCMNDTTDYGWFLAGTLVALGILLFYEKKRSGLSRRVTIAVRVLALPLLLAWTLALAYAAANLHKPLALRIAPPAAASAATVQ